MLGLPFLLWCIDWRFPIMCERFTSHSSSLPRSMVPSTSARCLLSLSTIPFPCAWCRAVRIFTLELKSISEINPHTTYMLSGQCGCIMEHQDNRTFCVPTYPLFHWGVQWRRSFDKMVRNPRNASVAALGGCKGAHQDNRDHLAGCAHVQPLPVTAVRGYSMFSDWKTLHSFIARTSRAAPFWQFGCHPHGASCVPSHLIIVFRRCGWIRTHDFLFYLFNVNGRIDLYDLMVGMIL